MPKTAWAAEGRENFPNQGEKGGSVVFRVTAFLVVDNQKLSKTLWPYVGRGLQVSGSCPG